MAAFTAAKSALTAPKPKALAQVEQARAFAKAGRVDEACNLAREAIKVGHKYGSERITTNVRLLRNELPRKSVAVTEFDEALSALYSQEER
ncbi:hypothetical protein GCM10011581_00280 [Saccharopolyspora subtropica]|uniref:Tetratricopeptide repeat protein n=2 Tax=Saccharopolyspora thermophila TaxID=89367 RepID=A0A917N622_9PSEU|nr:hypothetical protein GCM10011581_00280 [Saccharopolyspora subtropica]